MIGPFVNRGQHVFPDPTIPMDGGVVLDAAMIIPPADGECINGAPVTDTSHEFVLTNTTMKVGNAPNP